MKIEPVHVTCPNCSLAVENRAEKCPRCGATITWPKAEKPKAEKK